MATLVLSTVGTILGGPVGGAIGSLLGQSIDQQLFGPGPRHGPRLGDLAVQTSSYGSSIPQLFGKMRVAGSIVWATDLQETSQTDSSKGQPETIAYTYSVSLAVALSCRSIRKIGRIWADGKLIRTADGEFTVTTGFRMYPGSEDQPADALIASIEGIESTPAYRGLAIVVFEELELAEFGNRIPFLTFEVSTDPDGVQVATVLSEVTDGAIAVSTPGEVDGYAAYGASMTAAVQPLVDTFGVSLFDDGTKLSSASDSTIAIEESEAGCTATGERASRSERTQVAATILPAALTISYYDLERDYQSGIVRASLDAAGQAVERVELPAVLEATSAKALAETCLARRWAERDKLRLRLPPRFLSLRPGSLVHSAAASDNWRVERVTIDSLAAIVDLRPLYGGVETVAADSGRYLPSVAALPTPTIVAVKELPDDGSGGADAPVIVVGATSGSSWRAVALQIDVGGESFAMKTAAGPAVLGTAVSGLQVGPSALIDLSNTVEIELAKASDWLESRDDDALLSGANLAIIGQEIVQFGDALPLGGGRFRLSRLLRGRRGTEWAMPLHQPGEQFLLLDPTRLQRLPLSAAHVGASVQVTPSGLADGGAATTKMFVTGEAMRPPSPVHLLATPDPTGRLECRWIRRSRRGWDWLDWVDAPLGAATEAYRVTLTGNSGTITLETTEPKVQFESAQIADLGSDLQLAVAQIGDFAVSRSAILSITIS